MRSLQTAKIFIVLTTTLLFTGCAHQQLVDAGEEFNQQGRYELAVEKYQKALELKPNDRKTQQDLTFAQDQLNFWLEELHAQADTAKQQGLNGRALLLYGKVAQLTRDNSTLNHYKALRKQLREQNYYKIELQIPAQLSERIARNLANVRLINQADSHKANEFAAKISFTDPKFSTRSGGKQVTEQYVSGYETIPNPDYLHLQQDISDDRAHIAEHTDIVQFEQGIAHKHINTIDSLRKSKELAYLKMQKAAKGSSDYKRWQTEYNKFTKQVTAAEKNQHSHKVTLDKYERELQDFHALLLTHLNELSQLPPTAEREVYSDYTFEVKQISKVASGNVSLSFKNGPIKNKAVTVTVSDETHEAHPIIELTKNPLELPGKTAMTNRYKTQLSKTAESLIAAHAKDYRQDLKINANQKYGADEQLEGLVQYGLSSDDGVDEQTLRKMRRILEQEFGITGEFRVNQLLDVLNVRF